MRGLWREVNKFFSSTSIHGFPYISDNQSRSTRIIWTVIVLAGFAAAIFFLYETVDGFSEKYVTTTVETRSITEYPFPAVTFHPSDYNSKHAFKRNFLNQFEFTRYHVKDPLLDNNKLTDLFEWLVKPMNDEVFDDVEKFLLRDEKSESFINADQVCSSVALHYKNISLKQDIRTVFKKPF